MITALISFSPSNLDAMLASGDKANIDEQIEQFSFLEIVRSFRSGKIVKVETEIGSIDEIQKRVGDDFIVEEPSTMVPL